MQFFLALTLAATTPKPTKVPTQSQTTAPVVEAGPLRLSPVISETAQLFHIVDALSQWSPLCHRQYTRWFERKENGGLSPEDLAMLSEHASLRKRLGWGGLDAAFEVDASLEKALDDAVKSGTLSADDGKIERKVLSHFRQRVAAFVEPQRAVLEQFAAHLVEHAPALLDFSRKASRFFGGTRVDMPMYLVATTDYSGGGGFNGGKLVVEVSAVPSEPFEVVIHEAWHAIARTHESEMERAASTVPGLDFETLSEGLAYAVAPGIYGPFGDHSDLLLFSVKSSTADQFLDQPYTRFRRLALALRPSLQPALDGKGTFESFLPIEIAVYQGLAALAKVDKEHPQRPFCGQGGTPLQAAMAQANKDRAPRLYIFGEAGARLRQDFGTGQHIEIWSRPLELAALTELSSRIHAEDTILLTLIMPDPLPAPFAALLQGHDGEIAQRRAHEPSGEAVVEASTTSPRVIVLWATSVDEVVVLARRSTNLPGAQP
jgi:hypothetical protein